MKVKVNLNKFVMLDKDIDIISEQVEGETTSQGLPIYEVENITGAIYFDKGEFTQLCLEATYRDWETDRKSTRLNSSHITRSRMPSSA